MSTRQCCAGASGFLVKDVPPAELAHGVRTVAAGEALLAPTVVRRLLEEFVRRPRPGSEIPPELEELTERELEVLKLVASGRSNTEIASDLVVSETTIKTHVTHVLPEAEPARPGPSGCPRLRDGPRTARRLAATRHRGPLS